MQFYPLRVLNRRLQEDWIRDAKEDFMVLILCVCPSCFTYLMTLLSGKSYI